MGDLFAGIDMDLTNLAYILIPLVGVCLAAILTHFLEVRREKADLHIDWKSVFEAFAFFMEGKDTIPIEVRNVGKMAAKDVSIRFKIHGIGETLFCDLGTINSGESKVAKLPIPYMINGNPRLAPDILRGILQKKRESGETLTFEIQMASKGRILKRGKRFEA